ncbi:MAG: hypothetical protein NT002_13100 [candidate division Zixibacteria bacterium]|nr:hypothetical protein [candidate division Zixibacteria bacterium]
MKTIKEFLFFLTIALIPFQDTSLQNLPIGFLGAAPSFIPISLLLLIIFVEWMTNGQGLQLSRSLVYIVGYIFIITVVYLVLFGTRSHGTSLIFKSFNLSILTGLMVLPIFFLDYDSHRLPQYIYAAFLIAVAGVVLIDLLGWESLGSGSFFHFHENRNMRPRGFSLESSTLSATIITLGLLSAHYARTWMAKAIFLLGVLLITFYSDSKGGMIIILLTAAIVSLSAAGMKTRFKILFIGIIIIAAFFSITMLETRLVSDIDLYTSTSTRTGLMATSVVTMFYNPLGVGFSGFLPAINKYAPLAVDYLSRAAGGTFNFTELLSYVGADSDINISTKTFFFDNLLYFGLPFLVIFILFHRKLLVFLRKDNSLYLYAAVLFSLVALTTYVGGVGIYSFALVYGLAFREVGQGNRPA